MDFIREFLTNPVLPAAGSRLDLQAAYQWSLTVQTADP